MRLEKTVSDELRLELPTESAAWTCREATVSMGWEVESIEPNRLVMRRSWGGFSNRDPATIEVVLSEIGAAATKIVLSGRTHRLGSMRNLAGEMNRLRNAIEVAAHRSRDGQ